MNKCKLLILIFLVKAFTTSESISRQPGKKSQCNIDRTQNPTDGICKSIDVRNKISSFMQLENCTVIEGFLRITLIRDASPADYDQYSFPKLREITDHLLLYRVEGLKTLSRLFPNLTVIRGRIPFNNFAFVAYEMQDLEEIGLYSLRSINEGGIRLTKNMKLCYIDTIDWTKLGVPPGLQEFKENKDQNQCANYCPEECSSTKSDSGEYLKRCWTTRHCQKNLNCRCGKDVACMDNGTCCHKYCLGGCTGPGVGDCISCKGVFFDGKCHQRCLPSTYLYFERRCLSAKECLGLRNYSRTGEGKTMILRGEKDSNGNEIMPSRCVSRCPDMYSVKEDERWGYKNAECVKCQGFCPKVCNGTSVHSLQEAVLLEGCSKIVGQLIIEIQGGKNVADKLEKYLGNIKEVTGYITIKRSMALMTLYFLKSLEIIGGENLDLKSALVVMDNPNLHELFPEAQLKKMEIKKGRLAFHGNRKLCLYKIDAFWKGIKLPRKPDEKDISLRTNGDVKPCSEIQLAMQIKEKRSHSVVLKWEKDKSDNRYVLEYVINYKEVIHDKEDLNIYEGRDACSDNGWMTKEQIPIQDDSKYMSGVIRDLKPYTLYATYVQAYVLHLASHSAMTEVKYFRTDPYYPTEPTNLKVTSDLPNELVVEWKPPKHPNGNVTHYKVIYRKEYLSTSSFEQRNYCDDPMAPSKKKSKDIVAEQEKKTNISADCCACPRTQKQLDEEAQKQKMEVHFEDYLHKHVYCQRYDVLPDVVEKFLKNSPRKLEELATATDIGRRSENKGNSSDQEADKLVPYTADDSDLDKKSEKYIEKNQNLTESVQEVVIYGLKAVLPNLDHYQEYSIEVSACSDTSGKNNITKLCSNDRAITLGRTKANPDMDRVNASTIEVDIIHNSTGDVLVKWQPPPRPNGVILKYNLYYKRANLENLVVPRLTCVDILTYQKLSGLKLSRLGPGNWTFQIEPISLAGNGTRTPEKFFIIEPPPDEEDSNQAIIILFAVMGFVALISILYCVWKYARPRDTQNTMTVVSPNANYMPSDFIYRMDEWEVDRDKILLIKELGQGSFGMVYEGVYSGDDPEDKKPVAVKTVNDRASFNDKMEFLKEATIMKAFDCFHVVKLLGVVSTSQPALVIMELMALGDLKHYLRGQRPDEDAGVIPPNLLDILQMAGEIADGMAYLAAKKFVHRDLAARNCMVAHDKTVKVGDFGMARDIYETDYYRKGGKGMLPVRWMAPESLKDGIFDSMSDVWSYGVVMWEMVTLAAQPYQGLSNELVVTYISDGSTLEPPRNCPGKMGYLMQRCWAKKPKDRPTFMDIIEYLQTHLNERFEKVSYYYNEGGGPLGGEGNLGDPGNISDDRGSINHSSCEGAAASRPAVARSCGYEFGGSHDDCFQTNSPYGDMRMHEEGYSDEETEVGEMFPHNCDLGGSMANDRGDSRGECDSFTESGMEIDDIRQPFMSGDFHPESHKLKTPSLLHSGGDHRSRNSIELQPLIQKEQSIRQPEPSLQHSSVHNSYPFSSVNLSSQPSSLHKQNTQTGPESGHTHNAFSLVNPDPLKSGPPSTDFSGRKDLSIAQKPFTAQTQVSNSSSSCPTNGKHPTLRLPTLNQPPGGFRPVPLVSSGASANDREKFKTKNYQSNSNEHSPMLSVPTNSNIVNMEEGTSSQEEPSPNVDLCEPPTPDAITSSNEGSNESSKSSGSHSLLNGLANGHIPLTSLKHRPAPC